jgi:hypothetical protein
MKKALLSVMLLVIGLIRASTEAPAQKNHEQLFYDIITKQYENGLYGEKALKDLPAENIRKILDYCTLQDELLQLLDQLQKIVKTGVVSVAFEEKKKEIIQKIDACISFDQEIYRCDYFINVDFIATHIFQVSSKTNREIGWYSAFVKKIESLQNNKPLIPENNDRTAIDYEFEIKRAVINLYYAYFSQLSQQEFDTILRYYESHTSKISSLIDINKWAFYIRNRSYVQLKSELKELKFEITENIDLPVTYQVLLEKMHKLTEQYGKFSRNAGSMIYKYIKKLHEWSMAEKTNKQACVSESDIICRCMNGISGLSNLIIGYLENNFVLDKMVELDLKAGNHGKFKSEPLPEWEKSESIVHGVDLHENNHIIKNSKKEQKIPEPFRFQNFIIAKLSYMIWLSDMPKSHLKTRENDRDIKGLFSKDHRREETSYEIIDTEKKYIWSTALLDCIKKTNYLPSKEFYDYVMNFSVDKIRDQLLNEQSQQAISPDRKYQVVINCAK